MYQSVTTSLNGDVSRLDTSGTFRPNLCLTLFETELKAVLDLTTHGLNKNPPLADDPPNVHQSLRGSPKHNEMMRPVGLAIIEV